MNKSFYGFIKTVILVLTVARSFQLTGVLEQTRKCPQIAHPIRIENDSVVMR